jgi:cytochrome c
VPSLLRVLCIAWIALSIVASTAINAIAQLRGHGGPVRALAVSQDGDTVLSGSFDQSGIIWSLARGAAKRVLRFHEGAVNAVAILPDGHLVTAGEDGRIAIWRTDVERPERILEGHSAPIVALALSPDGTMLASASWDRTIRLWPVAGDAPTRVLEGHQQNVNAVAFAPDGLTIVSAGYDATVRIWPLNDMGAPIVTTLPSPLNALAIARNGEIIAAGVDGKLYFFSAAGALRDTIEISSSSVIALAVSGDGRLAAASGIRGAVAVIDRQSRKRVQTLVGPGLPVWSLAFLPDHQTLLTGGTDRIIRRWDAPSGELFGSGVAIASHDPLAAYAGDHGAEVFRACVACHTLAHDEGNRAGPSLHGVFGRQIATLPGYNYSEPLRHMNIVWSRETIAKLFEIGPNTYTPGTKMPEQRIGSPQDRDALVQFLERATK